MATAEQNIDDETSPLLSGDHSASTPLIYPALPDSGIPLHMFPPGAPPPPPLQLPTFTQPRQQVHKREPLHGLSLNEEDARRALLCHVAGKCCYGDKAAKEMTFNDLRPSSTFKYTLETFTETRFLSDAQAPYKRGERIARTSRGRDPSPWDVQGPSPNLFVDSTVSLEIPRTSYVKGCHRCYGKGQYMCPRCRGRGKNPCNSCNGQGYRMEMGKQCQCTWCRGSGEDTFTCGQCMGQRLTKCCDCDGTGKIKCYTQLTVDWKTETTHHAAECDVLPEQLIKNVTGQVVFREENHLLVPIDHFPEQAVNKASAQLIKQHQENYRHRRIVQQRHYVSMVPVTEVMYSWNGHSSSFFVFGFENKVFAPDYPQQCCCNIM